MRLAPRTEGYTTPHLAVFVKLYPLLHHTLLILYVSHNMYFATLKRPLFCKGYLKANRSYRLILYGFFKNSCTILQHTGGGVSRKALVAWYCDPLAPAPETPKINRYTFLKHLIPPTPEKITKKRPCWILGRLVVDIIFYAAFSLFCLFKRWNLLMSFAPFLVARQRSIPLL